MHGMFVMFSYGTNNPSFLIMKGLKGHVIYVDLNKPKYIWESLKVDNRN